MDNPLLQVKFTDAREIRRPNKPKIVGPFIELYLVAGDDIVGANDGKTVDVGTMSESRNKWVVGDDRRLYNRAIISAAVDIDPAGIEPDHARAKYLFDQLSVASYYGLSFTEILANDVLARKAAELLLSRLRHGHNPGVDEELNNGAT